MWLWICMIRWLIWFQPPRSKLCDKELHNFLYTFKCEWMRILNTIHPGYVFIQIVWKIFVCDIFLPSHLKKALLKAIEQWKKILPLKRKRLIMKRTVFNIMSYLFCNLKKDNTALVSFRSVLTTKQYWKPLWCRKVRSKSSIFL